MNELLAGWLKNLTILEPRSKCGLQVFGVRCASLFEGPAYLTLDEALHAKVLHVKEVSEWGRVPELRAINSGELPIFLLVGEQLVGAKQNRVVNTSVLLPAKSETTIPVSCVEKGRWAYRSQQWVSASSIGHAELRRSLEFMVSSHLLAYSQHVADQMGVWEEVRRKRRAYGLAPKTEALEDVFEAQRYDLEELIREHPVPEDCLGAVFAFGGRIAGLEVFDKADTLSKLWPKLIRSYGSDALDSRSRIKDVSQTDVQAWLQQQDGLQFFAFRPPGIGEDVRFHNQHMVGSALVVEGRLIHLSIFPNERTARF